MDSFYEIVIRKNKALVQDIMFYLSNVFMIIFGIFGLLNLQAIFFSFSWINLIYTLVFLASAFAIFMKKGEIRTEFEYTFTNGEIDFAKVFNNEKRKDLGTMKVANVKYFGKVNSSQFQKIMSTSKVNVRNWFLNRGSQLYYFYFEKDNKNNIIVIEPDDELVKLIRKYLPQGAYVE